VNRYSIIITLLCVILICVIWQQQRNARSLDGELIVLQNRIDSLQIERDLVNEINENLTYELANVKKLTDFYQSNFDWSLKRIHELRKENERLKDSLLNVPPDTVYLRMNEIYAANTPQIYRFSAPQIHFYYATYIEHIGNKKLLKTHENALNDCYNLAGSLRSEVDILGRHNQNLSSLVVLADSQRDTYKIMYEKVSNKYSNSKIIPYISGGAGFLLGFLLAR